MFLSCKWYILYTYIYTYIYIWNILLFHSLLVCPWIPDPNIFLRSFSTLHFKWRTWAIVLLIQRTAYSGMVLVSFTEKAHIFDLLISSTLYVTLCFNSGWCSFLAWLLFFFFFFFKSWKDSGAPRLFGDSLGAEIIWKWEVCILVVKRTCSFLYLCAKHFMKGMMTGL